MNADIQRYAQTMPQYREPLEFLQGILDFQTKLETKEKDIPLQIEPALACQKWRAGQPLLFGESWFISPALFREGLRELRSVLLGNEGFQTTLDRLLDSPFMAPSHFKAWLEDLIANSEECIQQVASATSSDPKRLTFLLQTVLSPFFQQLAAPYRDLVKTAAWRQGLCPICGSEPWMARLTHDNGRRVLACSLCHTEWAFDRLRCPFCQSGEQPQLRYFTVDGDEAHRVECCGQCRRYIKSVDERSAGQPVNLLAEDIITAHLDTLAKEQGYQ